MTEEQKQQLERLNEKFAPFYNMVEEQKKKIQEMIDEGYEHYLLIQELEQEQKKLEDLLNSNTAQLIEQIKESILKN